MLPLVKAHNAIKQMHQQAIRYST